MKYAVIILGLLAASYANAQNHLEDFSLKRSLKQDGLHLHFKVLDADKKGVRHHKSSKTYYWTKAQHVRATQGASSGQLLHGQFEAFYRDKQLAQKGNYRKGLKHGTWSFWNPNGTFQRIENWHNGILAGKQQFFDDNGNQIRSEFIHGKRKKVVQSDSIIHWKSFDRKTITLFDSVGQRTEVQNFKNDELHGVQKLYVNGDLESKQRYKKGALIEGESEKESDETEEKEPGKIAQLWRKLFKKEKQDKEKSEKEPKEKKRPRKEENAEKE